MIRTDIQFKAEDPTKDQVSSLVNQTAGIKGSSFRVSTLQRPRTTPYEKALLRMFLAELEGTTRSELVSNRLTVLAHLWLVRA
jgi:hypothetical protein